MIAEAELSHVQLSTGYRQSYKIGELLTSKQYMRAADLLHEAELINERTQQVLVAKLLGVACQICLVMDQCRAEEEWHRQAVKEASMHEGELAERLKSILELCTELSKLETGSQLHMLHSDHSEGIDSQGRDGFKPAEDRNLLHHMQKLWKRESVQQVPKSEKVRAAERTPDHLAAANDDLKANHRLVVYCFGTFQVYCHDEPVSDWPSRKGMSIFKYLLTNRDHPIHKEVLMDLFWPESNAEAARNNLNVAIYGLRQGLRNGDSSFSHILFQNDCYYLNPDLHIWVDYETFADRYQAAQRHEQHGDREAAMREYSAAEMLYQGTFLPDNYYEEWTEPQRTSLQQTWLTVLGKLSSYYLEQKDYAACIAACNKMVSVDPCIEDAYSRLMYCYSRQGQSYLALRQYHLCVKALETDLGMAPSPDTMALYNQIRMGESV